MKVEYINPFYQAANEVLANMLQLNVKKGNLETRSNVVSSKKTNISIGVTGDLKGSVVFSFSEEMALKIVEEMAGMKMDKLDKFVTSAIGELANIISGNAMTNLSQGEYECDIVPPQVIIGTNKTISMAAESILSIPLETDMGKFEINLSITEK